MRLLVVDDDPFIRRMVPPALARSPAAPPDLSVETVGTHEEAIARVKAAPPDAPLLVLCDYNLKAATNGLDVLADVAARRPDAVRVLFSGHAREEIRGVDEAGLDGFLEKPFRIDDLVAPLFAIAGRAAARGAPLTLGSDVARESAVRSLADGEVASALVQAASKGEVRRASALAVEARRRGRGDDEARAIETLAWQTRVLETIASHAPLGRTLTLLCRAIEDRAQGMLASVLLVDASGERLVEGAAPSLPATYNRAIDGLKIGPNVGSCGTAAFRKQRVIVTDTLQDPLWAPFRPLAEEHGLRACWSTPIVTAGGSLLGTFAIYYREPRAPDPADLELIDLAANLARAAIESARSREALERVNHRLQQVLDAAQDGIYGVDETGATTFMNKAGMRALLLEPHEVLGARLHATIHHTRPDGSPYPAEACPIYQAAKGGPATQRHGEWLFRKDGTSFPVEYAVSPIFQDGRAAGAVTVFRDVSARRLAEERFRALIAATTEIVWTTDASGAVVEDSPGWRAFTGQTLEEWQGSGWLDAIHPDDRARTAASWAHAVAQCEPIQIPYRLRRADGTYAHVLARAVPVRAPDGSVREWVGMNIDITDRVRAEQEHEALLVRERDARGEAEMRRGHIMSLFYQAPAAIAMMEGPGHTFTFANPRYERITGYSANELLGRRVVDVFPEVAEQGFIALLDQVYATGEPFVAEAMPVEIGRGEARRRIHVNFVYQPIIGPDGRPTGIMVHGVDVTPQVRAQEEATTLAATLDARVQERTRALEELNRELDAFAGAASHDLRAPLRAVHHLASLVLERSRDRLDPESAADLQLVTASASRAGQLVEALLVLSRVGRQELREEPVDLTRLAEEILQEIRHRDPARKVEVHVPPGLAARGDERLLRVVLGNLLDNAWKYTRRTDGARIDVGAVERPEGGRAFFVRDNGAGFDGARAKELFTPFHRLHTDEDYEGTGIGLATVARIVARHGGRAWAEGRLGEGATFWFTLRG